MFIVAANLLKYGSLRNLRFNCLESLLCVF